MVAQISLDADGLHNALKRYICRIERSKNSVLDLAEILREREFG